MKIVRGEELEFIPASHEDPENPGVFKRVLAEKEDLLPGRVQMINWARLAPGKSFQLHYHEDMEEAFVILSGRVEIVVGEEKEVLGGGDLVIIPTQAEHEMTNISGENVDYIVLGISSEEGGRTIVV